MYGHTNVSTGTAAPREVIMEKLRVNLMARGLKVVSFASSVSVMTPVFYVVGIPVHDVKISKVSENNI